MTTMMRDVDQYIKYENLVTKNISKLTDQQLKRLYEDLDKKVQDDSYAVFVKYNAKDNNVITRIDNKIGFIRQALTVAHMSRSAVSDILGTVKPWDNMVYHYLKRDGVIIPPNKKQADDEYVGGYVKDPLIGRHDWIISVDLTSLYPSIIRMLNMSYETLKKYNPNADTLKIIEEMISMTYDTREAFELGYSIAANGSMYSKDKQGIIPKIMTFLFNERKRVKGLMNQTKKDREKYKTDNQAISETNEYKQTVKSYNDKIAMYDSQQQALKILANSGYGAIGNANFRYYHKAIAEGITATGQVAIRYIANQMNKFLNNVCGTEGVDYVAAVDTDSNYIRLNEWVKLNAPEGLTKDEIVTLIDDYVTNTIEPYIEECYQKLSDYINACENLLIMKREAIADCAVFRKKKNYIINVYDNEHVRYKEPYLKMMGIETARTSTPMIVRKQLEKCLILLVAEKFSDMDKEVDSFKDVYYNSDIETIAIPRGVSDIDKWIGSNGQLLSGTPIHVRASYNYNTMLDKNPELAKRYERIKNGSKIKFIKLLPNNPINSHVVAFVDDLPKEFNVEQYVDKRGMYEDTFLSPLESFSNLVGHNLRFKVVDLSNMFDSGESTLSSGSYIQPTQPVQKTKRERTKFNQTNISNLFST